MSEKNYFKRITNITRYFLVGFVAVVCCATTQQASAYQMRDLIDDFNSGTHSFDFRDNGGSLALQYYNISEGVISSSSSNAISLQYFANVSASRIFWWQKYYSGSDIVSAGYVAYPLVGFVDNGAGGITFKYFVNGDTAYFEDFNVSSRAGFTHTFSDGYSCLMDKVYFNAGSIVFMCSDSYRTYQILAGSYTLGNHILYLDPYNSTNNVWWIALAENKAWSTTLIKEDLSEILYGDIEINQSLIESIFSTGYSSYTVSAGGSNFRPTCGLRSCTPQSRDSSAVGFVYSKDLITIDPDFGGGSNVDSNSGTGVILSGSISQKKSLEEYNFCIDRYIGVSDISKAMFACRSDYENGRVTREQFLSMQNYVLDLSSNIAYTGDTVTDSCFLMVDMSLNQFDIHSGTYNADINLAFRGSTSSNGLDLTYMCGTKPSVTPSEDGVNWWQDLLNRIGLGSSEVSSGTTVFDSVFDGVKGLVSSPIDTYVINPITSEYNSGYNVLNSSSCVVNNSSFAYGDYILYFGVVLIFIVLFGLFF